MSLVVVAAGLSLLVGVYAGRALAVWVVDHHPLVDRAIILAGLLPWGVHELHLFSLLGADAGPSAGRPMLDLLAATWLSQAAVVLVVMISLSLPRSWRRSAGLTPLIAAAVTLTVTMPKLGQITGGHMALHDSVPEAWLLVGSLAAAGFVASYLWPAASGA